MTRMKQSMELMQGDLDSIATNLDRIADALERMVAIAEFITVRPLRAVGIRI